jgi:hypothetical protein
MAAEAAAAAGGASWLGPAVIGAALIGGIGSVISGNKAAKAQEKAARDAAYIQNQQFNRGLQMTAPFQQAGLNALAMQGSLLGNSNLVPQSAIQQSLDALDPNAKWQAYTQQHKAEIDAFYRQNAKTFDRLGRDPIRAAEHYFNTVGAMKGHQMPTSTGSAPTSGTGAPGAVSVGGGALMPGGDGSQMVQGGSTGIGVGTGVDQAYNTFLDSGFGRSNLTTTNAEFENMVGAFGAGGKSMSGSAIGALNDRNRRNTAGAFGQYYNALSGISGTGAQIGSQQASQANQLGANLANTQLQQGNARASSYMNTGNAIQGGLQNVGNALAYGMGSGWFGSGGGTTPMAGRTGPGYTDMRGWG